MATRPPTILVVEDEPIVRMGITEHLLDEGFTVFEAPNAAAAITTLSDHDEIQLVFTDIDLGAGMDGLELCEAVQKRWPPVEIFVTSGRRQPEKADECRFARFFPKPYDTDVVTAAIRKAIAVG